MSGCIFLSGSSEIYIYPWKISALSGHYYLTILVRGSDESLNTIMYKNLRRALEDKNLHYFSDSDS
jgi:hypothetical protein